MKVTPKQAYVLENLHRIVLTQTHRKTFAILDGKDCRLQLVSLGARGMIRWDGTIRPVKIAEPDGMWKGRTSGTR